MYDDAIHHFPFDHFTSVHILIANFTKTYAFFKDTLIFDINFKLFGSVYNLFCDSSELTVSFYYFKLLVIFTALL